MIQTPTYTQSSPLVNDYTDHYIHTGSFPQTHVENIEDPVIGYPKLQKLLELKKEQTTDYATKPYGCRIDVDRMGSTLSKWIHLDMLSFDVVMIGCLSDNQFIYPLLSSIPIDKLVSKPGFLFIWASSKKINELSRFLNSEVVAKKFRRSEELVFVPIDKNSSFYPGLNEDDDALFEKMQWHCWMCITGTVRRATDGHLIHCNIDTDLVIEKPQTQNNCVPNELYTIAENFSTATKRLHIIPGRTGLETPVRLRKGWVIMSPDVMINNFDSKKYKQEIETLGNNMPVRDDIETLRPKSPIQAKN
ncbi:regulatory protein [Hanseniaspora vineae]